MARYRGQPTAELPDQIVQKFPFAKHSTSNFDFEQPAYWNHLHSMEAATMIRVDGVVV